MLEWRCHVQDLMALTTPIQIDFFYHCSMKNWPWRLSHAHQWKLKGCRFDSFYQGKSRSGCALAIRITFFKYK
jgi:hypothetical protein